MSFHSGSKMSCFVIGPQRAMVMVKVIIVAIPSECFKEHVCFIYLLDIETRHKKAGRRYENENVNNKKIPERAIFSETCDYGFEIQSQYTNLSHLRNVLSFSGHGQKSPWPHTHLSLVNMVFQECLEVHSSNMAWTSTWTKISVRWYSSHAKSDYHLAFKMLWIYPSNLVVSSIQRWPD